MPLPPVMSASLPFLEKEGFSIAKCWFSTNGTKTNEQNIRSKSMPRRNRAIRSSWHGDNNDTPPAAHATSETSVNPGRSILNTTDHDITCRIGPIVNLTRDIENRRDVTDRLLRSGNVCPGSCRERCNAGWGSVSVRFGIVNVMFLHFPAFILILTRLSKQVRGTCTISRD